VTAMPNAATRSIAAAAIGWAVFFLSALQLHAEPTIRSVGIEGTNFVVTLSDGVISSDDRRGE